MLVREEPGGWLIISQPAHSWVSGQLARQWNDSFAPREEVELAAELHDIGYLEWERAPDYNSAKGRPHDFIDLPFDPHLELWVHSVEQMLPLGQYAALLVSLHVSALCRNHMHPADAGQADRMNRFLAGQDQLQKRLRDNLGQDPVLARFASKETLERNRQLISVWDELSLLMVLAARGCIEIQDVPADRGTITLTLQVQEPGRLQVDPWPFRSPLVRISCEARRLKSPLPNESEMRRQLHAALPFSLSLCLSPKGENNHE